MVHVTLLKKQRLVVLITIFTVVIGACAVTGYKNQACKFTDHIPRENSYFRLIWSRPNIFVYNNPFGPSISGVDSSIFVLTQDLNFSSSKILAYDTQHGDMIWQKDITLPTDIVADDSHLFMGTYAKIQEYEPETGRLIKEVEFPNVGFVYNMYISDQKLYAYTKSGRSLTYNFIEGSSSLSEPFLSSVPFANENGILYLYDATGFSAVDPERQLTIWEHSINETTNAHPILADSVLVILTRAGNIYSLNRKTGKLIWELNADAISNIALDASHLYFLARNGYLVVLEQNNGREIQRLEFSPAPFIVNNPSSDTSIGAYNIWVDSHNNIIIVSLGDSCQLMALKYKLPQ